MIKILMYFHPFLLGAKVQASLGFELVTNTKLWNQLLRVIQFCRQHFQIVQPSATIMQPANLLSRIQFPSTSTFHYFIHIMHLLLASPRKGGTLGWCGGIWGLCNKFLPLHWGKCGDFTSVQLRGDWEWSIDHSIDGNMAEEKKKVYFKTHCFLSIKWTIHQ